MEMRCVEWLDSSGGSGWEELNDIRRYRPLRIFTVGFVLDEGDSHVTLLQSYDERSDGKPHGDHHITIPKFAIVKSRKVR